MNNLTRLICLLFVTAAMGMASCRADVVTPSNKIINKNVNVGNFSSISLTCAGKVVYSQGAAPSVRINGSDNIIDLVEMKNGGGKLTIKFRDGVKVKLRDDNDLVLYISSPTISSLSIIGSGDIDVKSPINASSLNISVTGSGDIETKGISATGDINVVLCGSGDVNMDLNNRANAINVAVSGSGDVECENPTAHKINCALSGSGDIDIKGGSAREASFAVTGSGDIAAKRLDAGIVNASVSGSGNIFCRATNTLTTSNTGSGDVKYYGNPKVVNSGGKKPEPMNF